ncbi:hypothetical protein ASV53_11730 [Photobacterium sanguinicancri]|uniref:Uncharacterized protein n=1 Tax=Photobacterium sanguinicancri TaxID=875932 RepID=A0ABX4FXY0_9GAMM|nr:hypothetical protein ASV53_11730 [Photobacterium sanguinicancri]
MQKLKELYGLFFVIIFQVLTIKLKVTLCSLFFEGRFQLIVFACTAKGRMFSRKLHLLKVGCFGLL